MPPLVEALKERSGLVSVLGDPLGRGGTATVHEVVHPTLGRREALKILLPELRARSGVMRRFLREAQLTGQLDHPHIVPVYALEARPDGLPAFTMKLVEGDTLYDRVLARPEGPLLGARLYETLQIVARVCDALAFAHSRGVIHCDVKPQNVVVGDYGQVYLSDWGIARVLEGAQVTLWVDPPQSEGVLGTPAFMAPEQVNGTLDRRTDVFGVGTMLYFVLTRHAPFNAGSFMEAVGKVLENLRPPVLELAPWVPAQLAAIVERAMSPDPADRHASVAELGEALRRFMRGGGEFPIVRFAAGMPIVREGDVARAAYVIVSGRCEVYRGEGAARKPLKVLGPNEVFGEVAILAETNRTASVVALEETQLMEIARDTFEQEVDAMKPWMGAFTRALARRFKESM